MPVVLEKRHQPHAITLLYADKKYAGKVAKYAIALGGEMRDHIIADIKYKYSSLAATLVFMMPLSIIRASR